VGSGLNWTLPDKTTLQFPYASGSNIPIMLTKNAASVLVGLTFQDLQPLTESAVVSSYLGVSGETNQNLTMSQNELLRCHWRLGHINMQWVQMMMAQPQNPQEDAIIHTRQPTVSSCPLPLCSLSASKTVKENTRYQQVDCRPVETDVDQKGASSSWSNGLFRPIYGIDTRSVTSYKGKGTTKG
jgi:hypothetical protein